MIEVNKNILFADDEQHELTALKMSIESRGYNIFESRNVEDALKILQEKRIDVLVLDIMMGAGKALENKLDSFRAGYEALDLIKEISPKTHVIVLTVVADKNIINGIRRKGALFVRKGETSLEHLVKIIESKLTGIYVVEESKRKGFLK